ncbi:MAG: hypothetical protein C0523_10370 [Cytophaga sp.]|nr:hypothetical protein [Cytophaga sp.]
MQKVYAGLKENWVEKADHLALRLNMDKGTVLGALSAFTQAGRVIYDINNGSYRIRELSRESLPLDELRFSNPREESANRFVLTNKVKVAVATREGKQILSGTVADGNKAYEPELVIDKDDRAVSGKCTCNFYSQNKMMQGPCEHMLALRMMVREKQKQ